jgi:hypothetical protein
VRFPLYLIVIRCFLAKVGKGHITLLEGFAGYSYRALSTKKP